jgi:hypothetical protein
MPHRDPETGQFVAESAQYDDIEMTTFAAGVGIQASDLSGGTGFNGGDTETFSGLELVDYDEFVDRNEELHLLSAEHVLSVYVNSTETADGTVAVSAGVSADPARIPSDGVLTSAGNTVEGNVVGLSQTDDSIDLIGRNLMAVAHAPYTDGSSGTGGGGSAGHDEYDATMFPAEAGRFHPRDELFLNGTIKAWNIDDAGVHAQVNGQHVYGVIEDC